MEHVVFFPGPDAAPTFRRFATLEEAVRFVEHLRNAEDVSEVSVHALSPVPVAFRTYYKVEVPVGDLPPEPVLTEVPVQAGEPVAEVDAAPMGSAPMTPAADPAEVAELAPVPDLVEDAEPSLVAVPATSGEPSSNGKRSLGFFAH